MYSANLYYHNTRKKASKNGGFMPFASLIKILKLEEDGVLEYGQEGDKK